MLPLSGAFNAYPLFRSRTVEKLLPQEFYANYVEYGPFSLAITLLVYCIPLNCPSLIVC